MPLVTAQGKASNIFIAAVQLTLVLIFGSQCPQLAKPVGDNQLNTEPDMSP